MDALLKEQERAHSSTCKVAILSRSIDAFAGLELPVTQKTTRVMTCNGCLKRHLAIDTIQGAAVLLLMQAEGCPMAGSAPSMCVWVLLAGQMSKLRSGVLGVSRMGWGTLQARM